MSTPRDRTAARRASRIPKRAGWLAVAGEPGAPQTALFVPAGYPLSYLRTATIGGNGRPRLQQSLVRALVELRTPRLADRMMVALQLDPAPISGPQPQQLATLANGLADHAATSVIPVLPSDAPGLAIALLSQSQLAVIAGTPELRRLVAVAPPAAGLRLELPGPTAVERLPVRNLVTQRNLDTLVLADKLQSFPFELRSGQLPRVSLPSLPAGGSGELALVWPNGRRNRADRGEFVVAVDPELYAQLRGRRWHDHRWLRGPRAPRPVAAAAARVHRWSSALWWKSAARWPVLSNLRPVFVGVENASDPGKFGPAIVRRDPGLAAGRGQFGDDRPCVAIDRGLRESLGIHEGEFARIHPWSAPDWSRRLLWAGFATRCVFAHPSIPLRADLEKSVCRLSLDAMTAIGARDGDRVTLEVLGYDTAKGRPVRRTTINRAYAIDPEEAKQRADWASGDVDVGFVDCAEFHGIYPAFPTVYVDYFDLATLLGSSSVVCPIVQVRPKRSARLLDDLSELALIVVIGLSAVVAEGFGLGQHAAILGTLALVVIAAFVLIRLRRSLQ